MYFPPDILLNNLVVGAISEDAKDNFNKPPKERTTRHRDALLHAIRSCGVSFSIWEKTNADGSGSGTYDFTSLMGSDKRKLLQQLPHKLEINTDVIEATIRSTVIELWHVSGNILHSLFYY
jgi:hypothetical protein